MRQASDILTDIQMVEARAIRAVIAFTATHDQDEESRIVQANERLVALRVEYRKSMSTEGDGS